MLTEPETSVSSKVNVHVAVASGAMEARALLFSVIVTPLCVVGTLDGVTLMLKPELFWKVIVYLMNCFPSSKLTSDGVQAVSVPLEVLVVEPFVTQSSCSSTNF